MRRVLEALEQRAIKVTKAEVDWLITDARSSIQAYVEDNANQDELSHALVLLNKIAYVLKIMQVHGGVLLATEAALVVEKIVSGEIENAEEAQDVVSRGVVRLGDYLEHVEAGNKDVPLVLMPLLNDLRASRNAALLSENVLFFPNLDNIQLPEIAVQPSDNDSGWQNAIRSKYQKALLGCVSGKDVFSAAAQICKLCIMLQKGCKTENGQRLWWLASALAQSVAIKGIEFSATIASIFSASDRKIKSLIEDGESSFADDSTESLVKNILYYLAIAEDRGRIVNQVKQAYALNDQIPENNELEELRQQIRGPSSEVLIAVSKALLEDVASAKDCIELFIHSEFKEKEYLQRLLTGLVKIGDTLSMIGIDEYREKIDLQVQQVESIEKDEQEDIDLALLDVSETILEVETCINNFIEYRINFQSNENLQDDADQALESEFSSNEHKAAFNVAVSEALLRIEQVKELLTEVVHISFDKNKCEYAVQNLEDIIGVINVIDLEAPTVLLEGICSYISSDRFKRNVDEGADALQDLADCVVSLQCYFEQIELRVPYADQILDYSKHALLRISGPEQLGIDPEDENSGMPPIDFDFNSDDPSSSQVIAKEKKAADTEIEQDFNRLPDLNTFEEDAGEPGLELVTSNADEHSDADSVADVAPLDLPADDKQDSSGAVNIENIDQVSSDKEEQVPLRVIALDSDPDVLETFIDEATQVIFDMKQHWDQWKKNQQEWQSFTEMRRGFHTLKGSGRFAGAQLLGELAWHFENLCNKLISKKDIVPPNKQTLLKQALDVVPQLIEQLKQRDENIDDNIYTLIQQAQESADDTGKSATRVQEKPVEADAASSEENLKKELTGIFSVEATQHLSVIKDAIEEQYDKPNQIRIDENLLRTIHTLRGSARTAGAENISRVCAPLEEIVGFAIKQQTVFSEEQVQLIQSSVMQIELAMQELKLKGNIPDIDAELINRLDQFSAELGTKQVQIVPEASEASSPAPTSADAEQQDGMIDVHGNRDEELCEIFFEEAEDVLASCQSALQRLQVNQEDSDALSELRRQLHTLKGSSRMAGFATIGELSHVTESLLVALVDRRIKFSAEISAVLQRVVDITHVNIDAAQAGQDIYLDQSLVNDVLLASGASPQPVPAPDTSAKEEQKEKSNVIKSSDAVEESVQDDAQLLVEATPNQAEHEDHEPVAPEIVEQVIEVDELADSQASSAKPVQLKEFNAHEVTSNVTENEKRELIRVQADVLDGLVNDAGEVNILHSRLEQVMNAHSFSINEFDQTVSRLRDQLRKLEMETEAQILFKHAEDQQESPDFDPLELDRYSDIQQLSRALAESVEDLLNIKEMFSGYSQNWEDILVQQHVVTTNLQDSLLRTRMVKFSSIEPRLQRIARQTSDELNKQVEVNIVGGDSEIDRSVLNRIIAPLEHILRNSIGHGIELPAERQQQGKLPVGAIKIEIKRENSEIIIAIEDDGIGIDPEKVRKKAIEKGLITADVRLNREDVLKLILKSGFSTAEKVTQIAGRGVGMDVVDKEIRSLGGALKIQSSVGKGARFLLRLPFTLAVSQALLVQAGKEIYALTLSGIEGVIRLSAGELKDLYSEEQPSYTYAGREYLLYHLGSLLQSGVRKAVDDDTELFPVLLVRAGEQRLALQVEVSLGNKEIVVKPLASQIVRSQGISGATILGDGQVALILDIAWIARLTQATNYSDSVSVLDAQQLEHDDEPTVMVVDDSITIRKVTTRFLERNNYKVVTAKDGVDALQKLQKMVPQLILLDIEMPRMDGYELAGQLRKDQRLMNVPIIMITSRTGDKHRDRAQEVGVNRYLGKPYNEAELLNHIQELQLERV